jgi:hypothetical protein
LLARADEAIERARIDLWKGALPPLLLFESRAAWGVSRNLCSRYLTPSAPCGGQCHGFLVNEIAPLLKGNNRRVLYVGDYELRGPADQIETHTKRVLERHAERKFTAETWRKIALTEKQVKKSARLRKQEITKFDNRCKPPKKYRAVECEALGQKVLLDIIRKQLDALLPEPLERVRVREERQRSKFWEGMVKTNKRFQHWSQDDERREVIEQVRARLKARQPFIRISVSLDGQRSTRHWLVTWSGGPAEAEIKELVAPFARKDLTFRFNRKGKQA